MSQSNRRGQRGAAKKKYWPRNPRTQLWLVSEWEVSVIHEIVLVCTHVGSQTAHQCSQLCDNSTCAEPDLPAASGITLSSPRTIQVGNRGCWGHLKHSFHPSTPQLQNPHIFLTTEWAHNSYHLKTVFLHQNTVFSKISEVPHPRGLASHCFKADDTLLHGQSSRGPIFLYIPTMKASTGKAHTWSQSF